MARTVHPDAPEVGAGAVAHDVVRAPDVNDALAVWRDTRIARVFEIEDVFGAEERRLGGGAGCGERQGEKDKRAHGVSEVRMREGAP